jgi:hypothetical protein
MAIERASIELEIAATMANSGRVSERWKRKEGLMLTPAFAPDERSLTISR